MKEIQLTQGKVALVDDEDWEFLHPAKWYAKRHGRTFYAVRNVSRPGVGQRQVLMHRIVLAKKLGRDIADGMTPDHDDGDGLNNTRDNLFEVTQRGQCENKHVAKTSQFVGVSWDKINKKWLSRIWVAGKSLYLGLHNTELAAALAREQYVAAHPELGAGSNFAPRAA